MSDKQFCRLVLSFPTTTNIIISLVRFVQTALVRSTAVGVRYEHSITIHLSNPGFPPAFALSVTTPLSPTSD